MMSTMEYDPSEEKPKEGVTFQLGNLSSQPCLTGRRPFDLKAVVIDENKVEWAAGLHVANERQKVRFSLKTSFREGTYAKNLERFGSRGVHVEIVHPFNATKIAEKLFPIVPFTGGTWEFCSVKELIEGILSTEVSTTGKQKIMYKHTLFARISFVPLKAFECVEKAEEAKAGNASIENAQRCHGAKRDEGPAAKRGKYEDGVEDEDEEDEDDEAGDVDMEVSSSGDGAGTEKK